MTLTIDAGNLPRVMNCNGSLVMTPDPVLTLQDATIREEGNAVHWLASVVFSGDMAAQDMVDRKAPNGVYITADMAEHVEDYISIIDRAPHLRHEHERGYYLIGNNWQINGRADHIAYDEATSTLYVDDLKYGYTIVNPEMNWTLISHAIGWCNRHSIAPREIVFIIQQPRAPHHAGRVRAWSVPDYVLRQLQAQLDYTLANPTNELRTGSHCYKCPSFASCPARQAAELNAIETAHIAYNAEIDNSDLADRLDMIDRAMSLLKQSQKAYQEQALHRITHGQVIENYAIDNDLTNRVWKDGMTPDLLQMMTGKDLCKRELPTPSQVEKSGVSKEFVAAWSERRNKGKKLIRADADKKAKKLFGDKKQ